MSTALQGLCWFTGREREREIGGGREGEGGGERERERERERYGRTASNGFSDFVIMLSARGRDVRPLFRRLAMQH